MAAAKKKVVEAPPVEASPSSLAEYLARACDICEHGSPVAGLSQIIFEAARLSAFNGLIQYQAPSALDPEEHFAVSEKRLAQALRSCGEDLKLTTTKEFLRLKNGPLTVRVRKIEGALVDLERIKMSKSAAKQPAAELHEALRRLQPFVSSDASRLWSVSVMVKDGYAWATNNLALVRTPVPSIKGTMRIPSQMVDFLCALPTLGFYEVDDKERLVFSYQKSLIRCPQSSSEWPDLSKFFAKMPKKLPEVPKELALAASTVGKFADRFTSISAKQVEAKQESIETEYEVEFAKGKGTYSAKLLSLILTYATHADFSFYPDPVFFRGEKLEGTAVGMAQQPPPTKGSA